jgi:hypothetical protein
MSYSRKSSLDTSRSVDDSITYESTRAFQSTRAQPDKIHWDREAAFRDYPYRQLHHQDGLVGVFSCRLLEASNLKRSYWSALALGPVKHLGLSKAHGAVSAYCTVQMQFGVIDPAVKQSPVSPELSFTSPVIAQDNSPVWDQCQWEFPLRKASLPQDGMPIQLLIKVEEDRTAVETLLPSPSQGRLLGMTVLDVTDLCLGETPAGQVLPGVRDAWIDLSMPASPEQTAQGGPSFSSSSSLDSKNETTAKATETTGRVRLLISYTPFGLEPQPKDIVALESFARKSPANSLSRPILLPLYPMRVLERRGAYLLVEYTTTAHVKACMRIHRNAVFVIERTSVWDTAHQLARLPIDVWESTPIGQMTQQISQPWLQASHELCKPALLTAQLMWMAVRTTGVASLTGFHVVLSTLWREGSRSLLKQDNNQGINNNNNNKAGGNAERSSGSGNFMRL